MFNPFQGHSGLRANDVGRLIRALFQTSARVSQGGHKSGSIFFGIHDFPFFHFLGNSRKVIAFPCRCTRARKSICVEWPYNTCSHPAPNPIISPVMESTFVAPSSDFGGWPIQILGFAWKSVRFLLPTRIKPRTMTTTTTVGAECACERAEKRWKHQCTRGKLPVVEK